MDQKREKFIELAEKRTTKALKSLRIIGNLSNRALYTYNEGDVSKIIKAIEEEVRVLKERFRTQKQKDAFGFKL